MNDNKGELTVKDKKMTIHIRLVSKKIVNLFLGSAKDAEKDGAELLQPTTDKVKYSDGTTEEVYGFDMPVEELGKKSLTLQFLEPREPGMIIKSVYQMHRKNKNVSL